MYFSKLIGVLALMLLALPAQANDTEDALAKIFGKRLYGAGGYVLVRKNGKVAGKFGKEKLTGKWEMRDGLFCRTSALGKGAAGTSCQTISLVEGGVKFTDKRGANRKPRTYTFKKP